MHKPFKKTHQNIRGLKMMYNPELQRRKGGFLLTRHEEEGRRGTRGATQQHCVLPF